MVTVASAFMCVSVLFEKVAQVNSNSMTQISVISYQPNALCSKRPSYYAGWMHAGYPIMGQKSAVQELVDVEYMRKHGLWGPIHELGHNQQRACWEFPSHTTECTCNLWSVYVHEEVLGMDRGKVEYTIVAIFIVFMNIFI